MRTSIGELETKVLCRSSISKIYSVEKGVARLVLGVVSFGLGPNFYGIWSSYLGKNFVRKAIL